MASRQQDKRTNKMNENIKENIPKQPSVINGEAPPLGKMETVEIVDDDDIMECEVNNGKVDHDGSSTGGSIESCEVGEFSISDEESETVSEPEVYTLDDDEVIELSSDTDSEEELEDDIIEEPVENDDEVEIMENVGSPVHISSYKHTDKIEQADGASKLSPREQAELKKDEGNEAYKNRNYRKSLSLYSEAIALCVPCEHCAAIYSNRAAALIMLCRYKDALDDCKTCLTLHPEFVKAHIRQGKCHLAMGDINSALLCMNRAKDLEPGNNHLKHELDTVTQVQALYEDAQAAFEKNDYRKVVFCMDRALEVCVASTRFRLWKAECLALLQRYQEAQEIASTILQFDSGNVDALYVRGYTLYYQDHVEKAFLHFQQVLRLAPDHEKTRGVYKKAKQLKQMKESGNELFKTGKYAEAHGTYTQALEVDEQNIYTNAKLYCNRAAVSIKLRKYEDATADLNKAISLDDNYTNAYRKRATCHTQLEDYDAAARDYEKIFKLEPTQDNHNSVERAKLELKKSKRKNYYKILGVSKDASEQEIKKAYKKRALMHHPDRHSSGTDQERKEHEKKFKEVGEAYTILSDARKKARYDSGQDIEEAEGMPDFDPNSIFRAFFGGGGNSFGFDLGGGHHHHHGRQRGQQQFFYM